MTESIDKPYLLLLNIKSPQPEHAKIQSKLNEISHGTSKAVYFDKNGGAFVFVTKLAAGQIYDRLIGTLLNDDRYIIVELGNDYTTFGNDIAAAWFKKHLNK